MEATEDASKPLAAVAEVKAETTNDKLQETLALVKALREEGAEVQVIIHYAEERAPVEDVESVEIGKSDWRQVLRVPRSLSLDDRNKYIQDRAVGAAKAFAMAMEASGAAKGAK